MNRMVNGLTEEEAVVVGTSIKEGFTSGVIGGVEWSISLDKHDWESDDDIFKVKDLILEGNIMGYYPSWKLEVRKI